MTKDEQTSPQEPGAPEVAPEPTDEPVDSQIVDGTIQHNDDPAPYEEFKAQADAATYEAASQAGYFGALAEPVDGDPNQVKTADAAAPEGADGEPSYFGMLPDPDKGTKPTPLPDLPAQPRNLRQTEDQQVGYFGDPPTSDEERESMTLSAKGAQAAEQYGNGRPEGS